MRDELIKSAVLALGECLNLRRLETIQIICDPPCFDVANAFYEAATPRCKETILTVINSRKEDEGELPGPVQEWITKFDVVVIATSRPLSHTIIKSKLAQTGVRIAVLPGITTEFFCRTMQVDWRKLGAYTRRAAAQLSAAKTVTITTDLGSDLILEKGDSKAFSDDGRLTSPGAFGNIPAGEVSISTLNNMCEGVLYIDGSFSLCPGLLQKPLIIEIKNSAIKKVYDHPCAAKLEKQFSLYRLSAREIAEFGIGTLESALVLGNVNEDKKAKGIVHVSFGTGGGSKTGFSAIGVIQRANVMLDNKLWIRNGEIV